MLKVIYLIFTVLTIPVFSSVDIHRVSTFGANVFIIETEHSLFLIDAGYPEQEKKILKKIRQIDKKVKMIILTHAHFDHSGSARRLKEETGAALAIHSLDSADLCKGKTRLDSVSFTGFLGRSILPLAERIFTPVPVCPDITLNDGDTLNHYGLNARILHVPGHTKGSIAIIVEDSIVFAGDLLINFPFLDRQRYYANSWAQIDSSIQKLCNQKFKTAYIGHGSKKITKAEIIDLIRSD